MRTRLILLVGAVLLALGAASATSQAAPGGGEHGGPRSGQCEDGLDNDNDGVTDADDPACQQPGCLPSSQTPTKCEEETLNPENPEAGNCDDGIDNDGDGLIDDADPDCGTNPPPEEGNCADGVDNDGDGDVDDADADCTAEGCVVEGVNTCDESSNPPPEEGNCADGVDNDGDGDVDDADSDCTAEGCVVDGVNTCDESSDPPPDTETACDDGLDNDGDGLTDGDDPDCQGAPENLCTGVAGDPGLLTDDTLGQTVWDGGISALTPLTEDPERNGAISGPLGDALTGTPLEPVGDEGSCAVDLLLDENTFPDL